ncbi:MAG TPA: YtxH domain-containing protein [Vicinamibacterales bacterium]|jgi:gas vesicle protein|nr:YtxH domain-containing protein [Vicinamibacterales bacterium]
MYEPHYEEESGGGGFVIGLLCGAALGAAVALMLAPKTGSELRQTLYESTGDIRKKASDAYDQASQTVNDYVAKGRDAVERGKQAFESARQGAGAPGRDAYGSSRGDFSGTSSGVQS